MARLTYGGLLRTFKACGFSEDSADHCAELVLMQSPRDGNRSAGTDSVVEYLQELAEDSLEGEEYGMINETDDNTDPFADMVHG